LVQVQCLDAQASRFELGLNTAPASIGGQQPIVFGSELTLQACRPPALESPDDDHHHHEHADENRDRYSDIHSCTLLSHAVGRDSVLPAPRPCSLATSTCMRYAAPCSPEVGRPERNESR